jgi:dipeptidyl aminopeptidase/acylaminoacyl peptidase
MTSKRRHACARMLFITTAWLCVASPSAGRAAGSEAATDKASPAAEKADPRRRFTVADAITFADFVPSSGRHGQSPPHLVSPDGTRIAVVTMRGEVTSGKREAVIWLVGTARARDYAGGGDTRALDAALLARFGSAANRNPISEWRWSKDSRDLLFLGADDDGARRIYRVNSGGGTPVAITPDDQDVSRYDEVGGRIVYLAHRPIRAGQLYQAGGASLPDIEIADGRNILPLLFPNWLEASFDKSQGELWTVGDGAPRPVIDAGGGQAVRLKDPKLALSPDGRRLVVSQFVPDIPKSWERYQPLTDSPGLRIVADTPETRGSTGHFRPQRYALIDLETGATSVLVDSPIEFDARFSAVAPLWSSDGRHVALPGAYPLIVGTDTTNNRILPCEIMIVDLGVSTPSCVREARLTNRKAVYGDRQQLTSVAWVDRDRSLVARHASSNAPNAVRETLFRRHDDQWTIAKARAAKRPALSVTVEQSIDTPPILAARLGKGASRTLLDPNPQLREIALGKASLYNWRDGDGDTWSGALVTPPGFAAGKRYPLVIQTHNLDRGKFLLDGPSATGFAARALAGRDIVVLQVDEIGKGSGTYKESPSAAAGYRAAIAQLTREGIVDPARVGIIAWSHMGPYALQGLIDDPGTYAAATLAESSYTSLGEYLMNIDYMGPERETMFREQMGAKPFGDGLKLWLDRSPGFHTERVCAPTLFQYNSPVALVYGWDIYAALRAQAKPVDLLYIRGGDHVLVKPLQRLAEQGMNVDWYDYWLNGRTDPDPAKAPQYRRWEAMKGLAPCRRP